MSVNMIAASRRVSVGTVLLASSFIGPNYSADVALLSAVHDMRANAPAHRELPTRGPSAFSQPQPGSDAVARDDTHPGLLGCQWQR